jgi:hypothetical protein
MNKKIITALVALSLIIPTMSNAKAETSSITPTVAVLDTALDINVNTLQGKIAHEVCILEWNSCPNGKNFQEGPGSSYIPLKFFNKNGFEHGTQMTSVLTEANPDIKIVFVRIIGNSASGSRQITNEVTFVNALDWVINNKDRFNIQAVTMSQGHGNFLKSDNYCPNTPRTVEKIKTLVGMGIPVFLPTGNARDYKRINWPACLDDSVSVGAVTDYDEIPIWSNIDTSKVDLHALGFASAMRPTSQRVNISGTSVSVQIAAAQWMALKKARPELTYSQILDRLKSTSTKVANPVGLTGLMINIKAAISG